MIFEDDGNGRGRFLLSFENWETRPSYRGWAELVKEHLNLQLKQGMNAFDYAKISRELGIQEEQIRVMMFPIAKGYHGFVLRHDGPEGY